MKKITIIGLGYRDSDGLSREGYKLLFESDNSDKCIICRTKKHAVAEALEDRGVSLDTLDRFYEESESFDDAYSAMGEYILSKAQTSEVLLLVSGTPSFGDVLTQTLAQAEGVTLSIVGAEGIAEHVSRVAGISLGDGYSVIPAHSFKKNRVNTHSSVCITEVDNKFLASEIKLALMEMYPEDSEILYFYGHPDTKFEKISLFDMDRQKIYDFSANFLILPLDNFAKKLYDITALCEVMRILRGRPVESDVGSLKFDEMGCSWDREQTHESIRVNMIEEAYEVVEAINNDDLDNLIEELGDMLLQVVFHSQIAQETGEFDFSDVVNGVVSKLIRRHPHVFGDTVAADADQALASWEEVKKQEKTNKSLSASLLALPKELPPLTKACKVLSKAQKHGLNVEYSNDHASLKGFLESCDVDEITAGELLFIFANAIKEKGYDPDVALLAYIDRLIENFTDKSK